MISARKGVDTRIGARSRMFLRDRGLSNRDSGPDDATCLTGWPPDELEQHFNISSTHLSGPRLLITFSRRHTCPSRYPQPDLDQRPLMRCDLHQPLPKPRLDHHQQPPHKPIGLPAARSRSAALLRCDLHQPPQISPPEPHQRPTAARSRSAALNAV